MFSHLEKQTVQVLGLLGGYNRWMEIKSREQCLIQQERPDPGFPGPPASAEADQPSPGLRQGRGPGGGSSQPSEKEAVRLTGEAGGLVVTKG